MNKSIESQIEQINAEIKQKKELLKLFLNGEDYYEQKIKKLKTEFTEDQLTNLKEDDLKNKIEELSNHVQSLKKNKPMLTIYEDSEDEKSKIKLDDIQQFILSFFDANFNELKIGLLKNSNRLDHVCIFVIEDDRLSKLVTEKLSNNFQHHIQFTCGDDWIQNLLKVTSKNSLPFDFRLYESKKEQTLTKCETINNQIDQEAIPKQYSGQKEKVYGQLDIKNGSKSITCLDLLLSMRQLIREGYPLPIKGSPIMKTTKSNYKPVTEKSPLFSLDCEMCKTINGDLDVTRISLIDEQMNLLLDEYVKPELKIINYLTPFSGITEKTLANVTTTLKDIHEKLDKLLPEDAILIGHSLNCDLNSLRLCHPYIIDTSCIYNFTIYLNNKPSLKQLANYHLNKDIQSNESGHCSIEDAKTAMQLVHLKLSKDITFGDNCLINRYLRNENKLFKPTMTLSEYLKSKNQPDIKIFYDYLDIEQAPKFFLFLSKHLNKVIDKINWTLSLNDSICVLILKEKCMINLN